MSTDAKYQQIWGNLTLTQRKEVLEKVSFIKLVTDALAEKSWNSLSYMFADAQINEITGILEDICNNNPSLWS